MSFDLGLKGENDRKTNGIVLLKFDSSYRRLA